MTRPSATDQTLSVRPNDPTSNYTAVLIAYDSCSAGAKVLSKDPPTAVQGSQPASIALNDALIQGAPVCVGEFYTPVGKSPTKDADYFGLAHAAPPPDKYTPFSPTTSIFAAVAGLEITGASSTSDAAVFHASAVFDVPLAREVDGVDKPTFWLGGNLKIAGIAQPGTLTGQLGDLSSTATYLASATNATPDKIVQSIETSANFAVAFPAIKTKFNSLDNGDADDLQESHPTIIRFSGIVNAGAITPASASQLNPPVYVLTNQLYTIYGPGGTTPTGYLPIPASCNPSNSPAMPCYITFIPQDRSRFYRHYEAGFRLKMYGRDFSDHQYRFPAITDLTIGQNEYVTGGKFQHLVLHLGGWVPIPRVDAVYLFGSMDTVITRNSGGTQLILVPASNSSLTYTSTSVYQISVQQPNRDRYTLGFGVDLYHLVSVLKIGKKNT